MMKKRPRSAVSEPTMMIHHVKEIQIRFLVVVSVLILGMIVGYIYHEPLFTFIKAPLNGPLHYTSPSGSFTFIINICMLAGVVTALPVLVYNLIMFAQPALDKRLSRARVYLTTFFSLLLATGGGAFAFFVIIPLALRFFYKFQVDGLVALISADDYLHFVVNVIITFILMFQLPLFFSLFDHIKPLPPKKLFKAEKYIVLASIVIAIVVPFAVDPIVQFLIASPIVVLYNVSIGVVLFQRSQRSRAERRKVKADSKRKRVKEDEPVGVSTPKVVMPNVSMAPPVQSQLRRRPVMQDISGPRRRPLPTSKPAPSMNNRVSMRPSTLRATPRPAMQTSRLISDIRPTRSAISPPKRDFPLSQATE